jgi:hypothetical protein
MYRGLPSFSSEKNQDELPAIIMINLIDKNGSQGKLGN